MNRPTSDRRSFLIAASAALAGTTQLRPVSPQAQAQDAAKPLYAYVGTFSSPLSDVLPTQVEHVKKQLQL